MRKTLFGLVLYLSTCTAMAASFEMDVLETEDLRLLYFDPVQTFIVPHMSRSYHSTMDFQREIFNWEPWDQPTVLLTDLSDYGNAGASVSPDNGVTFYIAPLNRTLETLPGSERTFMLMNHELVHVSTMDAWNETEAFWRRLFRGKPLESDQHPESILYNYLTVPRMASPRWFQEGSAVFLQTWMSGGVGRAQGAYDEMVFRAMVRDDAPFYSNLGIVSEGIGVNFQVGVNSYLYGTRFFSYLAYEYSPEAVIEWLSRGESSERYYAKQFQRVFGLPLDEAWQDWIVFEKAFQEKNLARVREKPITASEPIVDEGLGSISRAFLTADESRLVAGFRYPGTVAHLGTIDMDTGKRSRIADIKGPKLFPVTSPAFDPASNTLFYTADNTAYRDLMAVDIDSGEPRMLLEDARVGDIVFNKADRSIWGLRHLNGYVSLVRIPYPYNDFNELHTWPYGRVAYELDLSADGRLLSLSMAHIDGTQRLQVFETDAILNGNVAPMTEYDFGPSVPEGFVFTPDSRYLYGSSFITGVSNILRFDLETGELEGASNAETGFFRPIPRKDGSLLVFEFTGDGFVPTVISGDIVSELSTISFLGTEVVKKHPVVKDWTVIPDLREIDHEALVTHRGKYRPGREIGLGSAYPVIEGYRDATALGWHFNFSDPANFHRVEVTASVSVDSDAPGDERLHFNAEYQTLNWDFRYWHNDADFYDLFGPTKYARKGDAFMVGYEKALIFDEPRELTFHFDLDYFTGLDTLPAFQNVSTFQFEDILSADVALDWTNTRKSLGAVDHEKGLRWDLRLGADHAEGSTIGKAQFGLDFGVALPWKHASVWLYNAVGAASGDRANPLASYYFGGFGNNYVDNGSVKRYRDYDSMPGFDIDEVGGQTYGRSLAELNLPPVRFREVGTPGLFLNWMRPALFFGSLWTDPGDPFSRTVRTVGGQVDLRFMLGHRLPMTLSVGYARGLESGQPDKDEWMLSLKVL